MKKLLISAENAEFQVIQALKENRTKRSQAGEAFVEGIEAIKQASSGACVFTRIIAMSLDGLSAWAKVFVAGLGDAKVIEMRDELYKKLCDRENPSELIATVRLPERNLESLELPPKPFVLIFDRPSDLGNLGSIIRSADSFGVDAILLLGHGVDPWDSKVIRSSLGAVFHTRLVQVRSMQELSAWVTAQKDKGPFELVGSDSTGEVSLSSHSLRRPLALVLGNEAKGMSVALKELCDYTVSIPLCGAVNSLNVSCAGSILLWEVCRNGLA